MTEEQRVGISSKKCKRGRSYHLRWFWNGKRRSKSVGTNRKRAVLAAATLEEELGLGTYTDLRRIPWDTFVDEVVGFLDGVHRDSVAHTLKRFGDVCQPSSPSKVTHATVRDFVLHMREKGNAVATENKALRELRLAFNCAVRLNYVAKNPVDGWNWRKSPKRELRILSADEETRLLTACDDDFQLHTLVRFLLDTWARISEATGLRWERDVVMGDSLHFRSTKSHEDRFVPIDDADLWLALRRLKLTGEAGPFVGLKGRSSPYKQWHRVVAAAGIKPIAWHDLRRTGITRALLAGMPTVNVQALAGHRSFATTAKHYVQVQREDLRNAKRKLREQSA